MDLFIIPPPTPVPYAQTAATTILANLNDMLRRRVADHAEGFHRFWDDPAVTPDALITTLGDANAKLLLATSRENLRHLSALAALVGKTLNDVLPPTLYEPRRAFIEVEGQPLTLAAPAAGSIIRRIRRIQETPPMIENLPTHDKATAGMIDMMAQLIRHSASLEQATTANAQKLSELEQKVRELDGQFRNSRSSETFR